ncbi:uncharacterized protein LOC135943582 isoform X2 [Cloeon dipterum]|uniref:uncharacterized protein LOC135943582 isoform X2 n=1 Tax=Cloeon dipterum TaxID=197152 RepID=UPI003220A043
MEWKDMGGCLSIMTCNTPSAADDRSEDAEEEIDGALSAAMQPLLRNVVAGGMAAEPQVPRMTPEQVACINNSMESLVTVTNSVSIHRIIEVMRQNGVEIEEYKLTGDNSKTEQDVRQFYTKLLYLDHPNMFEELCNTCHLLGFDDINKHFIKLMPSRPRPITRQISEESETTQTMLSSNGDEAQEEFVGMNEEQRNLIMSNINKLADHISNANLKDAVDLMSDVIPSDQYSYFKTSHTNSKIVDFFSYVTQMECEDPYRRLAAAFMRNTQVTNILSQYYYSKPRENISYQNPPRQTNGSGAKPSILTEKLSDINPDVKKAVKEGAYNEKAKFVMETHQDLDAEVVSNPGHIKVKPSRKRFDLDANNKLNRKEVYRCLSNPKGSALVLNIYSYPHYNHEEKERQGSEIDTKNITALLRELGFLVTNFPENLKEEVTAEMFKGAIRSFAQSIDHYCTDVCFMVIMAHGEELETSGRGNAILCSDGKSVPMTWIHSQFSSQSCKFLIGKPKVFCYQTCRGMSPQNPQVNQYNPKISPLRVGCTDGRGHIGQQETVIPTTLNSNSERILDDMLVCHAAPQGFQAQRDREIGSVFIRTIIEVFVAMAHDTHVQRMMVEVDRKIKSMTNETFCQTTTFESIGFDRELYLHPHLYRDTEEEPEEGASCVTEKAGTSEGGDC